MSEKEAAGEINADDILKEARQIQFRLNVTPEYKLYICMCGIFGPHRNIVKNWSKFEAVFTTLINQNTDNGVKNLF